MSPQLPPDLQTTPRALPGPGPAPQGKPSTTPLTQLWNRIPSHPGITLFSIVIGITGLIIGWLSLASVEPVYYASSVETIARKDSPHLTMKWDNEPIESLCVGRVAFWNAGKLPITQDRLPSSDPLRIVSNKPAHILSTETVNSSRPTMSMKHSLLQDSGVALSINGGDALERNDGIAVRILFTGDCQTTDFRVIGSNEIRSKSRAKNPTEASRIASGALTVVIASLPLLLIALLNRFRMTPRAKLIVLAFSLGPIWFFVMSSQSLPVWLNAG